MVNSFQALVVRKNPDKTFSYAVETCDVGMLGKGEVLVRVSHTAINFKDTMSCQGNPAITRRFPHIPGTDAAGIVEETTSAAFSPGDRVIVVSSPMGMNFPGGFSQYVRVPEAWVMKLDDTLGFEQAMAFGTAGFTAALSLEALAEIYPSLSGLEAVVTGATGGVGSFSVALLKAQGCRVTAITGKADAAGFLRAAGADEVLNRHDLEDTSGRNMLVPTWDLAIDVAGGNLLSTVLKMMKDNGAAIATGMVGGTTFEASILPFILRGARLVGINAENTDMAHRQHTWTRLATDWKPRDLASLYSVVPLDELPAAIETVARGEQRGRIVVDVN